MRWRTVRDVGLAALIPASLFAGAVCFKVHEYRKLAPRGQTVKEHLAAMPEPLDYRLVHVGGQDYLTIHSPPAHSLAGPSGGPVYIFDQSGVLVDWVPDAGDSDAFHARWPGVYSGKQLNRAEVEARVNPKR